jgi:4-hydroxy-4-methyl-2-oxoglutarate aldolase
MPVQVFKNDFTPLPAEKMAAWAKIPPAIAGDCMNRQNVMAARISPVAPGMHFVGQARTIGAVAGDNAAMHTIISMLRPGEVLVIDAENYDNRAVWGGILNSRAMLQQINGVVIDGAVRDVAELRQMPLHVFASAISPAGPHKGWGGSIDDVISCGGVSVTPGDIILADDDGVTVVPLARADSVLAESQKKLQFEADVLQRLASGEDTSTLFPLPDIEYMP